MGTASLNSSVMRVNSSLRPISATAAAAAIGAGAFLVLLPVGDPCSFRELSDVACVPGPCREDVANAAFFLLCFAIGAGAALAGRTWRPIVGAAAATLAIVGAHCMSGWVYGAAASEGTPLEALTFLSIPALFGALGGALSRYVPRSA